MVSNDDLSRDLDDEEGTDEVKEDKMLCVYVCVCVRERGSNRKRDRW